MKTSIQFIFAIALLFAFSSVDIIACTISEVPLRKQFRKSNAVFVGKVLKIEEYNPTKEEKRKFISENWQSWTMFSKVTFEVRDKWKGNVPKTKEFLAAAFYTCGCDQNVSEYEIGKEYLIYAPENNFVTICDSKLTLNEWVKKEMKRLDSFSFRLWARIYLF